MSKLSALILAAAAFAAGAFIGKRMEENGEWPVCRHGAERDEDPRILTEVQAAEEDSMYGPEDEIPF